MPLGFGIVGAGQRCMYFFGPDIRRNADRAKLVAIAEPDQARLRSALDDLGGDIHAYEDIDGLLEDPLVDAVIIASPDFTHRELLDKVLDAGKHVICEKPMATTPKDARHMTRRARAAPEVVQIGFMLRYAPMFIRLKGIVDSGVIGELVQVGATEVIEYYHGASFFRRWQRFRKHSGGLLVHKACHALDVINWIVGSTPAQVSAIGGTDTFVANPEAATRCRDCDLATTCPAAYRADAYNYTYPTVAERADPDALGNDACAFNADKDIIDNATVMASYENGVRLTFNFVTTGQRHERRFMLVGNRGIVTASQADGTIVVEPVGGETQTAVLPEELRDEHGGGDEFLLQSFLDSVGGGEPPTADVMAGMHSLALALGAEESIDHHGAVVDLGPYLEGLS